jgi:hypothetical protein
MNNPKPPRKTWLFRLATNAHLHIYLTILFATFLVPCFRAWWRFDWPWAIFAGGFLSVFAAFFSGILLFLALSRLFPASFCDDCPSCGERALDLGMQVLERTDDPNLRRVYCLAHFRRLGDGTFQELPNAA